jgi:hypothetical protein
MNLHNTRFALRNVAIWIEAMGRNGRGIGIHLWPMVEGEPPPMNPMPNWNTRAYWTPERFGWRPFQQAVNTLFNGGYVRPLCGKVSQARRPRAYTASYNGCPTCATIARQRGIMAMTYSDAADQSTTYQTLSEEAVEWRAAGRPDQWPQPTT